MRRSAAGRHPWQKADWRPGFARRALFPATALGLPPTGVRLHRSNEFGNHVTRDARNSARRLPRSPLYERPQESSGPACVSLRRTPPGIARSGAWFRIRKRIGYRAAP
jgi:hypothetical protein